MNFVIYAYDMLLLFLLTLSLSVAQLYMLHFSGGSHRGFDSRAEAEDSYLRLTLARERDRNRRLKNYYIIALLLIVIALLFYIFV
jgi:quinol-cytochrome oxidoreductase complex cytochrome b subunit